MAQVVELLPYEHKVLSSNLVLEKLLENNSTRRLQNLLLLLVGQYVIGNVGERKFYCSVHS
jgi:hypothetical protein